MQKKKKKNLNEIRVRVRLLQVPEENASSWRQKVETDSTFGEMQPDITLRMQIMWAGDLV